MATKIYPSILSCDFAHLQRDIDRVEQCADGLHVDVMDGHFVSNLSFGAPVFRCIATKLPLSVHLMVSNPEDYVEEYADLGVQTFTFHIEASSDPLELCRRIRASGMRAGISINPETDVRRLEALWLEMDEVLVMSVHPGFGGQQFIPEVLEKVTYIKAHAPHLTCAMDGGINEKTAVQAVAVGVDILIAGSYIFKAEDSEQAIETLRAA